MVPPPMDRLCHGVLTQTPGMDCLVSRGGQGFLGLVPFQAGGAGGNGLISNPETGGSGGTGTASSLSGTSTYYASGGGGAGGLLSGSALTIDTNSIYVVTVGSGGAAGSSSNGVQGTSSTFSAYATTDRKSTRLNSSH